MKVKITMLNGTIYEHHIHVDKQEFINVMATTRLRYLELVTETGGRNMLININAIASIEFVDYNNKEKEQTINKL